MKLSIIIVAFNNGNELLDCVNSIFQNNDLGEDLEVIVVDNSPNDRVEQQLAGYEGITYIKNPENGFGRGNNIGFHHSKGQYILFLNPDTIILNHCFKSMIDLYSSKSDCGMAGFRLVDEKRNENYSFNFRFKTGLFWKLMLKICRRFSFFISRIMYTSGADILIDRDTFEAVGKFDESIFMYSEETDISYRINRINKKGYFFNSISIIHLQGMSSSKTSFENQRQMWSSIVYCAKKYNIDYKKILYNEICAEKFINLFCKGRYPEEAIDILYSLYK